MDSFSSTVSPSDHVATLRSQVEKALGSVVANREPAVLYDPVEYVLEGGGKRVRPTLLLLVAEAYGRSPASALPAALAVEVFHNFTLVHDDIMDEAQERRGRPTVHEKWDVGTAILTGDLLMGLSYELLGDVPEVPDDALYEVYHPMVEKLCSGQALDASFEGQAEVSVDAYLDMIDGKTAALLSACFELGAVVGGSAPEHQTQLRTAGRLVGRAFQIQDDLLDLTADGEEWGKAVGGDLVTGKKTYLTLRALERAEGSEYDWFARLIHDGGLPPGDVEEARARMDRLGVFEEARAEVTRYSAQARNHLTVLPSGQARETLGWLIDEMEARSH
ncbi:polyprenyl synthetase [Salinibacter sp. 10B]|uniref:polyprenyl synthetase family protein n=1 Tax=Salinibacter sp. 10B TaxID=1923971 RepID=UPI000CF4FF96|nr:polyprenyl synthetase family protein [Salinibacter sp. 10B]PQJ33506.1 polyprenyl synthetase [Salinibacter sp. 10B]